MVEIYGTLGPACASQEMLEAMFRAGMTGIRLNMSHGGLLENSDLLTTYHRAAKAVGMVPGLLIDMQGPELRIGNIEPTVLKTGDEVLLGAEKLMLPDLLLGTMESGDELLLDDGKIAVDICSVCGQLIRGRVRRGGKLTSRKSVKLTGKEIPLPVSTQQDLENIRNATSFGVTAIMQPFVRHGRELQELRQTMETLGADKLKVFAKIETMEGVENLETILPYSDVIVIARGDLGNDMPLWKLPAVQKKISTACRSAGKPFVVVTQMLASMEQNPIPTRAEVSDIFNAVADGAYGVMVTNETAVGYYPVEAISYLACTAKEAEDWIKSH